MDDLEHNRRDALEKIKAYIAARRPELAGCHFDILAAWEFAAQPPGIEDEIAYHVEAYGKRLSRGEISVKQ